MSSLVKSAPSETGASWEKPAANLARLTDSVMERITSQGNDPGYALQTTPGRGCDGGHSNR